MNCVRHKILKYRIRSVIIKSVEEKKKGWTYMELDNNAHSVFLLYYHLILVIKYRKKILTDKDHVQILFRAHPNSEISKFINAYKSASSRLLKKEFPQIRQKLWKECFWSQSFCLLTTGGAPIEVIRKYIESQGEKSRKRGRSYGKQSI